MVAIIIQSLKLYCLLEYKVRKGLKEMSLAILPEGRKTATPSGLTILQIFEHGVNIIQFTKNNRRFRIFTNLNQHQATILKLLDVPKIDLRHLSRKFGSMRKRLT